MTKTEFIIALKSALRHLPQTDVDRALSYYCENIDDRIEDGMSEADAVGSLGHMDSLVRSIEEDLPIGILVKNKIVQSKNTSKSKALWLTLVLCGIPLWFPLVIAGILLALAVYVVFWSLIISLYAVVAAFAITGICGLFSGIVLCFVTSPVTGLMIIGMALTCCGLFFLCILPVKWLSKQLLRQTVRFSKYCKGLFATRREAV